MLDKILKLLEFAPTNFKNRMEDATFKEVKKGRLTNVICTFHDSHGWGDCYLNISRDYAKKELDREAKFLELYSNNLTIPTYYYYYSDDKFSYLVTSEINGIPMHEVLDKMPQHKIVNVLITALNSILTQNLDDRLDVSLEIELAEIKELLDNDKIDTKNFIEANGTLPTEIYNQLIKDFPKHNTNVLSHGDFCIPNILISPVFNLAGLIDWGKVGIGDIHRDIAALHGSLIRNDFEPIFNDLISNLSFSFNLDMEKINYYKKVDQFWYNALI